jgi:hypothetical protein
VTLFRCDKTFFFVADGEAKKARMLVSNMNFLACVIFANKGKVLCLTWLFDLGRKFWISQKRLDEDKHSAFFELP